MVIPRTCSVWRVLGVLTNHGNPSHVRKLCGFSPGVFLFGRRRLNVSANSCRLFDWSLWFVMPENIFDLVVTPADVDWIDHYGAALVHGHRFTLADVANVEYRSDRTTTGRLHGRALERIARILTDDLSQRVVHRALRHGQDPD